jgi:hypothetical protein
MATGAYAQMQNDEATTLVLHGSDAAFMPCTPIPFDCTAGPTIDVTGFSTGCAVWLCLRNYDSLVGMQCAFDTAWVLQFGQWDCQGSQVNGTVPAAPFGETAGTIATAFNAISGGTLAPVGRMFFVAPASGCLDIIESSFPFGTHVVKADNTPVPVVESNRGRLCVGAGGIDACEGLIPVEPATWGNIKSQYR